MSIASPLLRASLALSLLAGCSLINAPDEINPGTGGAGATGGGGSGPGPGGGGSGGGPACTEPADCASLTTECADGDCQRGACVAVPRAAGTACGAAPSGECDLADACDGAGQCTNLTQPDGTFCGDCPAGPGLCGGCSAGMCSGCPGFASTKTFRHPLSTSGWQLEGAWRVFSETPPLAERSLNGGCNDGVDNDGDGFTDTLDPACVDEFDPSEFQPAACGDGVDNDGDGFFDLADPDCEGIGDDNEASTAPIRFSRAVLGNDGNRGHPYGFFGSAKWENATTATSPLTRLPAALQFRSWHMDEGQLFDLKAVLVSTDGVQFESVGNCAENPGLAFCTIFPQNSLPRAADDWDDIVLPLDPKYVDQLGYVRFLYNTKDALYEFERGWYVDALNFAQDCACNAESDCDFADSPCGAGSCDVDECIATPTAMEQPCSFADKGCSEGACNEHGLCEARFAEKDGTACDTCEGDQCQLCLGATCLACPDVQTVSYISVNQFVLDGFSLDSCVRANSVTPDSFQCFPSGTGPLDEGVAPMIGSDGVRTFEFPFVGAGEVQLSRFVTAPTLLPASLEFKSWHQDRGGNDTFALRDTKVIRISVDGGSQWTALLDCEGNMTVPFCIPWPSFSNRPLDQWDAVSIPIPPALVGQTGIFEFVYDTVDAGQGWERGWYMDDFNINRCDCNGACPSQ